ncbi:MAG TPA: zinc ribbon domain-containing protein [Rhodanobacteraceae bacterium]|nr:zinc ribbon domain-containing protein [Rhodanobacteraceae bacterium]
MPIYAFRCETCGHAFDRLQKLSDPDPGECPECGAQTVKRQVTAPAFRLAGSGWYETDFKSDKDTRRNLAGKDESSAPAEKPADKPARDASKATEPKASPTKAETAAPASPSTHASGS